MSKAWLAFSSACVSSAPHGAIIPITYIARLGRLRPDGRSPHSTPTTLRDLPNGFTRGCLSRHLRSGLIAAVPRCGTENAHGRGLPRSLSAIQLQQETAEA